MGWLFRSMAMGLSGVPERRARRRKASLAVEDLEGRQLLAPVVQPFATVPGGAYEIIAGEDGNLWADVQQFYNTPSMIDRIGPDGSVTSFPVPGNDYEFLLLSLANGPDGNLWFAAVVVTSVGDPGEVVLGKVTPTGHFTLYPILHAGADGATVNDLVNGPGNALWFDYYVNDAKGREQSFIGRVTSAGTVTLFPVTGLSEQSPEVTSLVPGTDGNLWFTESAGGIPLSRMTPTGVVTHLRVPPSVRAGNPLLANGPNGSLFISTWSDQGRIGYFRVSPSGAVTPYTIPPAIRQAFGSYLGTADGSLWFLDDLGPFELGRIMPNGSAVAYNLTRFVPAGTGALDWVAGLDLAAGKDGNLYVVTGPGDLVYRIVPSELQPEQEA